jgi:short-subunit dehydrogenase
VQGDVSKDEDNARLVARALEIFGEGCPIILVNNAGVESALHFDKAPVKKIDQMLDINLKGTIHLTHAFLPSLIKSSGHVVNIASILGKVSAMGVHIYSATKFGLIGFGQGLRMEMKYNKHPVTVHTVCPGIVKEAGMADVAATSAGGNLQDCLDLYGDSYPHHTGVAVVKSIQHDHPEWIVNSRPVRALAVIREAFPRFMDFLGGLTDEGSRKCNAFVRKAMDHQTFS